MRVIHRETEEKALLRGHALEVVDLQFLPGQDVIATVANDGNVYVWRLSCVGSEIKCVPRPISTADPPHPPTHPPLTRPTHPGYRTRPPLRTLATHPNPSPDLDPKPGPNPAPDPYPDPISLTLQPQALPEP